MSEGQNNDRDMDGSGDLVGIKRATSNPYALIGFAVVSALGAGGSLALYPAEETQELQRQLNAISVRLSRIENKIDVDRIRIQQLESREVPPPWFSRRVDEIRDQTIEQEKRIDALERGK